MSQIIKHSLEALIHDLKKDPSKSAANFEATTRLAENFKVNGASRQFKFDFDEPEAIGGDDSAPNPVEYVLATLGECQAITYKIIASLKGIEIDTLTIKTKGNLDFQGFLGIDNNVRPGFLNVEYETTIGSDESFDKLVRLSQQVESLCPVLDVISNPVEVQSKVLLRNSEGTQALISN